MIRVPTCLILIVHLSLALSAADLAGTWKLNVKKSTARTEYASDTVKIEQTGPLTYRFTYDVVSRDGQKFHSQITRIFDDKSRAIGEDTVEINDHPDPSTWISTRRKAGKIIDQRHAVVDNQIQTVMRKTLADDGRTVREVMVFERQ